MADTAPLARQWRLLQMLSARRQATTVRELAAEMNVVDKTIRRDLQCLAGLGFPLVETVGEYGRKSWRLDFPSGVPPLSFTLTEIAALHVGRELMLPLAGTDFGSGAHSAFRKIRSALGDAAVKYLAKLAAIFHTTSFGASDYSNHTAMGAVVNWSSFLVPSPARLWGERVRVRGASARGRNHRNRSPSVWFANPNVSRPFGPLTLTAC